MQNASAATEDAEVPAENRPSFFELFTRVSSSKKQAPSPGLQICPDLIKAVEIAEGRARGSSTRSCWRYVKRALLDAEVVETYPETRYAKEAARELTENFDFVKLKAVSTPEDAPIGSLLVYGGKGAGHIEFRTSDGFVSDFHSERPSNRPLIGVFIKTPEAIAKSVKVRKDEETSAN